MLSNALKYGSSERIPKIRVSTYANEAYTILSVKDNGMGIDLDANSEDLFQAFKRIHTKEEGSGIGLYIIQNLVESAGGKIEVKSRPNVGSEFLVYIK